MVKYPINHFNNKPDPTILAIHKYPHNTGRQLSAYTVTTHHCTITVYVLEHMISLYHYSLCIGSHDLTLAVLLDSMKRYTALHKPLLYNAKI